MVGGVSNNAVVVSSRLACHYEWCDSSCAAFADDLCHSGPRVVTARLSVDVQSCGQSQPTWVGQMPSERRAGKEWVARRMHYSVID